MDDLPTPPQLTLRLESEVYDPSDARWRSQVQQFLNQLNQDVGTVRQEVTPVAGQKGGAVDIILALGTAGAFTTALAAFTAWLKRDKTRVMTIEIDGPDGKKTVKISGENLTEALVKEAVVRTFK
jgi:hypothetical protein